MTWSIRNDCLLMHALPLLAPPGSGADLLAARLQHVAQDAQHFRPHPVGVPGMALCHRFQPAAQCRDIDDGRGIAYAQGPHHGGRPGAGRALAVRNQAA
ncbi:MAG: hypothetical protein H6842_03705 [Rhodospirillaceae bacterium]|nr:hypothetical protein [Rhodospirillaceae bacterium]